ncbi:hypothetical protein [Agrococcus baldri]|uniref:Uncharacterized protein n=1 Tax=Agrococcus baldri TaxID=153730 RepID=A0AA87RJK3_9MICO|nr:hypothetical protein [Agrococcus baldri]GEK81594.1 hypothetical protein ABA31_29450 [Agrococcus baldri]
MYGLRRIAILLLACLGLLAAGGGLLWLATATGLAKTEIVASSEMAPGYEAGDLLVTAAQPGADAADEAGQVTLRLPVVGGIVSAIGEPRFAIPTAAGVLLLAAVVMISAAPAAPARRA